MATQTIAYNSTLLRRVLQFDSVSTLVGALGFFGIAVSPLASLMGFNNSLDLYLTSGFLVLCAILYWFLQPRQALVAVIINDLWVLGSIALLLLNEPPLLLGKIWIALIALIVATFGILEFYLLRKR
jgi:hypothetical protein